MNLIDNAADLTAGGMRSGAMSLAEAEAYRTSGEKYYLAWPHLGKDKGILFILELEGEEK